MLIIQFFAGVMPVVLVGIVTYVSYVMIGLLCIDSLINPPAGQTQRLASGIVILCLFCILLLLMAISFFRLLWVATISPGLLTVKPADGSDLESATKTQHINHIPRIHEASLSLEDFHSQEFFECTDDGQPKWCNHCNIWKPDRAHHSKMIGRCIRRFDHYCPWVGGCVTQHNFKFFIQFSLYAASFSFLALVSIATLWAKGALSGHNWQAHWGVTIGFGVFFVLLAGGTGLSGVLLAMANLTTLDNAHPKSRSWQVAVRIPDDVKETADDVQFVEAKDATFVIVKTAPGDNPYDMGVAKNWRYLMGRHWWNWFLPMSNPPLMYVSDTLELTPAVAAALESSGITSMTPEVRETCRRMRVRQKHFPQLLAAAGAPLATIHTWLHG